MIYGFLTGNKFNSLVRFPLFVTDREHFPLTTMVFRNMLPIGNMNPKTPKQLGAVIRERRRQMKVTQKDLALTCGTGLRFIIDLEKGKPTCQIGKILLVVQALGLEIHLQNSSSGKTS